MMRYIALVLAIIGFVIYMLALEQQDFKTRCRKLNGTPVITTHNGYLCYAKDNTQIDWSLEK